MDISSQGLFGMGTFWYKEFSAPWMFRHGMFQHLNILAHGYFGTFQSNLDISSQTFRHLCYCAEMSMCRNIHGAKKSLCQKVPVPKSPCTETSTETECSMWPKHARAEMSRWSNVHAKMSCRNVRCQNGGKPNSYGQTGINFASISILLVEMSLVSLPNKTFSTWSFQKQTCSL